MLLDQIKQSIGEPCTQLTLNSVVYDTEILVRDENKKITCIQIGDFVQSKIKNNPDETQYYKKRTQLGHRSNVTMNILKFLVLMKGYELEEN